MASSPSATLSTSSFSSQSSPAACELPSSSTSSPSAAVAPKPCCVCKDEKAARDECMLFSTGADPAQECQTTVEKYRSCMRGYGFETR